MNSISSPTELIFLCIRLHYTVKYYYCKEKELKINCRKRGLGTSQKFESGKKAFGVQYTWGSFAENYIENPFKNIC